MYVNTLIELQENIPTYGIEGKKVTGHVMITSPGSIRCYVQNLNQKLGRKFDFYVFNNKRSKGVKIGTLGDQRETKWFVEANNVKGSGIKLDEIDGVALVLDDGQMRSTNAILTGFKNDRYMLISILDELLVERYGVELEPPHHEPNMPPPQNPYSPKPPYPPQSPPPPQSPYPPKPPYPPQSPPPQSPYPPKSPYSPNEPQNPPPYQPNKPYGQRPPEEETSESNSKLGSSEDEIIVVTTPRDGEQTVAINQYPKNVSGGMGTVEGEVISAQEEMIEGSGFSPEYPSNTMNLMNGETGMMEMLNVQEEGMEGGTLTGIPQFPQNVPGGTGGIEAEKVTETSQPDENLVNQVSGEKVVVPLDQQGIPQASHAIPGASVVIPRENEEEKVKEERQEQAKVVQEEKQEEVEKVKEVSREQNEVSGEKAAIVKDDQVKIMETIKAQSKVVETETPEELAIRKIKEKMMQVSKEQERKVVQEEPKKAAKEIKIVTVDSKASVKQDANDLRKLIEEIAEDNREEEEDDKSPFQRALEARYMKQQEARHSKSENVQSANAQSKDDLEESKEEVDYLQEIERKLKEIQERLRGGTARSNEEEMQRPVEKQVNQQVDKGDEIVESEDGADTAIRNILEKMKLVTERMLHPKQEETRSAQDKEIDRIYESGELVEAFAQEEEEHEWVKIPYAEFIKIPSLSYEWCTQPFITFAFYKYNEILLGRSKKNNSYCIGIPDIYHSEHREILGREHPINSFLCRKNLPPTTGEYGYWIIEV